MFRETIDIPIDPIPAAYINTLTRPACEPDFSLSCLGVALLKHRIENYSGLDGKFVSMEKLGACVNDFKEVYETLDDKPTLCYYVYNRKDEADEEFIKERLPDFKIKTSISVFVQKNTGRECFVAYHETKNIAAVFIDTGDFRIYHLLLTFIPLYFPSIFNASPMKPEEYEMIKALSKKDKDSFIKSVQNAVAGYVTEFRRIQLGTLLQQMHDTKINNAKQQVEGQRANVADYENRYVEAIKRLKELIVVYEGMMAVEQTSESEEDLIDFLSTNKEIHNLNIVGSCLYFSVATYLNNYNEQAWDIFSQRGYIYDGRYGNAELLDVFKTKENRKILLDNIFSDSPEFMVKIAGNYRLDMSNSRVSTDNTYNYERADPMYKSYLPNPHLKLFSCLGGYKIRVMNELKTGNYVGAINLCVASAGSVDLDETEQTFRPFIGWILKSKQKILRRKDGVEMTPEEALIWLIDKEKDK